MVVFIVIVLLLIGAFAFVGYLQTLNACFGELTTCAYNAIKGNGVVLDQNMIVGLIVLAILVIAIYAGCHIFQLKDKSIEVTSETLYDPNKGYRYWRW